MRTYRRRVAAVLVLAVVSVGVALLLGRGSNADAGAAEVRKAGALSHALLREREQGGVSGAEGADAQSYADRAFRVTALTVDPKCKAESCTLYVAAAGGGVWRSKNALAPNPSWKQISAGIPTN